MHLKIATPVCQMNDRFNKIDFFFEICFTYALDRVEYQFNSNSKITSKIE